MKKLIWFIFLLPQFLFSQIIQIPGDYSTIQGGINASSEGDTILVQQGIYYENINFHGKNITVASNYLLSEDSVHITNTIIDGNQSGRVITFESNETNNALLCGFTIRNGFDTQSGAGIYCYSSGPTLKHLIISDNKVAGGYGNHYAAGIACISSCSPIIKDVSLIRNRNEDGLLCDGVALFLDYNCSLVLKNVIAKYNSFGSGYISNKAVFQLLSGDVIIEDVHISDNQAITGIYISDGNPSLKNVTVESNYTGLRLDQACATIVNSVFSKNSRYGISVFTYDCQITILNSTIADNDYGGIYIDYRTSVLLKNSIVWGSTYQVVLDDSSSILTVLRSDILHGIDGIQNEYEATVNWLEGNINFNPMFDGSGEHPYKILDYHSPCIDGGTPDTTGLNLPGFDLAGDQRIVNDTVDMGAYEWNTIVGMEESSKIVRSKIQVITFPNPFSTSTTISYNLPQQATVQITIYNHIGKQVEVIQQKQLQGKQQVSWDASRLPSGVYYFRLQAGEQVASGKMVLVR